jgi:hypothetical protein
VRAGKHLYKTCEQLGESFDKLSGAINLSAAGKEFHYLLLLRKSHLDGALSS